MREVTVEELSRDLDEVCEYIAMTQEAVTITVDGKPDTVLMSIKLYEKMTGEKVEIVEECE